MATASAQHKGLRFREDLAARRERFGLSYFVTSDRDLPALAEIIGELSR